MIIIRPILILVGFVLYYIPILQFVGIALLFFSYHILIKNRKTHIERMKKVYESNNWNFPEIDKKNPFLWFISYIISIAIMSIFYTVIIEQIASLSLEELQNFVLPSWQLYLILGAFVLSWISYSNMINRIIKDQWQLQESELQHQIVKNRFIKLRDGNVAMLFRIITLDIYEWFLLFFMVRETTMHYFEDGSIMEKPIVNTEVSKNHISQQENDSDENSKVMEDEEEKIYDLIVKKIKNVTEEEKYSAVFSEITSIIDKDKAQRVLKKLLDNNYITQSEYEKIKSFL